MNRKVLLIEPNYKNKYPPMGLMKIATYYRIQGDNVRFYKGDMKALAVELICEDLIEHLEIVYPEIFWKEYYQSLFEFIKIGRYSILEEFDIFDSEDVLEIVKEFRKRYRDKEYFTKPRFDKVGITTLFTFYWNITINTINFAKQLCKDEKDVMVGGIMATLLPNEVYEATGIHPFEGLLDKPGAIDPGDNLIIDQLSLDYSILEEIDYVYPANNAYFAYMTRGCVNKCKFCAVPRLEPQYCDYISLKEQIKITNERFGTQRDLLLLDNNVLASKCYEQIIDEIKECGFGQGATYIAPNEYEITIRNLRDSYNDRAYIRKAVKIYKDTIDRLKNEDEKTQLYMMFVEKHCLYHYTATKEAILELDEIVRPLYEKTHKPSKKKRIVDFNQGIDSRLITNENMKKLSEVNIYPLRIAFDHWKLHDIYENSVERAVNSGIKNLSNYLLYNFEDKPDELYYRLEMNVNLCEKLDASIYSFPMKYHPINDPEFFMNRDYIGVHWNRKFIRAVQAVLNSTKGKIGRGKEFFEEAFGSNIDEFHKILWMPETFIIYRRQYDANLRERLAERYTNYSEKDCDLANEWWKKFNALSPKKLERAKEIIALNKFKEGEYLCDDADIESVLWYYKTTRNDAEK
ncbi:hypothetical protein [Anaeromicropila populeti]|uniref:Radical SAM superfamily enzyme YgiQ, UPF0313 family n=1 Tax=Anaeromicropila populeti TaxID=37658 RepID=A0A1I6LZL2_9FIRM|nr:hypothetical protein [Anaeromicropila populeti]SFS08897.1 hypothetical protein SAMN05661086_03694 [Anaeromicropila populeti]